MRSFNAITPISFIGAAIIGTVMALSPIQISITLILLAIIALAATMTTSTLLLVLLIVAPLQALLAVELNIVYLNNLGIIVFAGALFMRALGQIARHQRIVQIPFDSLPILLLLFILVTGLSAFGAVSIAEWAIEWSKWIIILTIVIMVQQIGRWEWLFLALSLAGIANALIGIYIFFGGSGAEHFIVNGRFFRAFGSFWQPNPFGGFMGLLAPIASMCALGYACLLWRQYRHNHHISLDYGLMMIVHATSAVVMIIALVLSWSRGAWLGFAASGAVMVFALPDKLWKSTLLLAAIMAIGLPIWFSGKLPATITERVNSATEELFTLSDVRAVDISTENYAIVERLAHWQAALNMAEHNPWLGVGFGNYAAAYDTYRLINWDNSLGHAHNYYLNVFAETGIIGLMVYLLLFGHIIHRTWGIRHHPDPLARFAAVGLLGTWTYLSMHSLTDNLYVNNVFIHLGVLLGVLELLHHQMIQTIRYPVRLSLYGKFINAHNI